MLAGLIARVVGLSCIQDQASKMPLWVSFAARIRQVRNHPEMDAFQGIAIACLLGSAVWLAIAIGFLI